MQAHSHSMFPTKNGVYVVSATKLAAFNDCLAGFFLRYVFRYPIEPHISTVIGSAVHRTIDYRWRYFKQKGDDVYPIEPVYDLFLAVAQREQQEDLQRRAEALEVSVIPRKDGLTDQDRRRGLAMAVLYRLNHEEVPEHTEYEFMVPYPNAREPLCYLYGFYDQLYPWGFIDLKSNYTLPTVSTLATNIQFILYAWVFEQLYQRQLTRGYWYHLRTGQKVAFYPLQDDQRMLLDNRLTALTRFLYMIDTDAQRRGITVPPTTDIDRTSDTETSNTGTSDVGTQIASIQDLLQSLGFHRTPTLDLLDLTRLASTVATRKTVQPYVKKYFQAVLGEDKALFTGDAGTSQDICRWCATPTLCRRILSFYYKL